MEREREKIGGVSWEKITKKKKVLPFYFKFTLFGHAGRQLPSDTSAIQLIILLFFSAIGILLDREIKCSFLGLAVRYWMRINLFFLSTLHPSGLQPGQLTQIARPIFTLSKPQLLQYNRVDGIVSIIRLLNRSYIFIQTFA